MGQMIANADSAVDKAGKDCTLAGASGAPTRCDKFKVSWPTRITLFRIVLVAPFVICMLDINDLTLSEATRTWLRYVAIGVYLSMAVSDGLDGHLARRRGQITRLGMFLDPVADKLLMISTCLLLASPWGHVDRFLLPRAVVVLILSKDLLIVIGFAVVYLMTSRVYIAPVFVGKLTTFLQLVMGAAILLAPELSGLIPAYDGFLKVLWWSAAGTAVLATLVYIREGVRYIECWERARARGAESVTH